MRDKIEETFMRKSSPVNIGINWRTMNRSTQGIVENVDELKTMRYSRDDSSYTLIIHWLSMNAGYGT